MIKSDLANPMVYEYSFIFFQSEATFVTSCLPNDEILRNRDKR